jgi:hypothetical protein
MMLFIPVSEKNGALQCHTYSLSNKPVIIWMKMRLATSAFYRKACGLTLNADKT